MSVIVDTNVALVASRHHERATDRCIDACIKRLVTIQQDGGLVVDDIGLILFEYTKKLGHSGQPGAGAAFAKWAHDHQAVPSMVRKVAITPRTDGGWRRYDEFPDRSDLSRFHHKDQKFVAVAIASGESPPILNALDSDWRDHQEALASASVVVEFLCPTELSRRQPVR